MQHIEFIDGSNPYICKTKREFARMKEKYVLEKIKDDFWKATDRITYRVVGFADKNKPADFNREYKTKSSAMRFIRTALKEKRFCEIILRKEESYLKNNENLEISSSGVIQKFTQEDEA